MLLSTLALTVVFGLGAVEQRKTLLAESAEERVSTHLSLASTLHYRNEADIAEALLPALETKPKKVWMRALHVDGEILATASLQQNNAAIPTLSRNSDNRTEVLTSLEWPSSRILSSPEPAYVGPLAAVPFMNAQFLIMIVLPQFISSRTWDNSDS